MRLVAWLLLVLGALSISSLCWAVIYETEPNNTIETADTIVANEVVRGQLYSYNEEDWFKLYISNSNIIQGILYPTVHYDDDWEFHVHDSNGNELYSTRFGDSDLSPITITFGIDGNDTYYFNIISYANSATTDDYEFMVNGTSSPQSCCLDTDSDGVPDVWDECADTSPGSSVNGTGCPQEVQGGFYVIPVKQQNP